MTHPWHEVTPGLALPYEFMAVIEIPRGSSVKYELDKTTGLLRLEGKSVEVDEFQGSEFAAPIIESALDRYSEHRRHGFHARK
jgi:inorganic pyrophosphatase